MPVNAKVLDNGGDVGKDRFLVANQEADCLRPVGFVFKGSAEPG